MSAANTADPSRKSSTKKKRRSKKKANGKLDEGAKVAQTNGVKDEAGADVDEEDEEDEGTESPVKGSIPNHVQREDTLHLPSSPPESVSTGEREEELPVRNGAQEEPGAHEASTTAPPRQDEEEEEEEEEEEDTMAQSATLRTASRGDDASSRLDAMQQERDNLRAEVTQLRQSLESLQERHSEDISGVREELEQSQQGKEQAEAQYRTLLSKVNTIRSQLGERLRADAEELEQARGKIDELEASKTSVAEENERFQASISDLNTQNEAQASELDTLRSRTNLSTSNWAKERDDMISREAYIREEYEVAKQAMQDWEILATEERSRREALEERAQELEEQLGAQREAFERVRGEAETQSGTVDGLQRALRDVQEERKRELREMVTQSQSRLDELRAQTQTSESRATDLEKQLSDSRAELARTAPFEQEVREKNLLIGKLRHNAVTLNDHLTKALRFLKRGKPEDNVDRQLVTNHLLQFLQLDRSDAKKFQVLQLIAALLGWTEEQREAAGLLRQGGGSFASTTGSLKLPMSPFRRTPSTPSLSTAPDFSHPESPGAGSGRESLAELWSEFLEREAEAGVAGGGGAGSSSRTGSLRSPTLSSITSPTAAVGRQSPEMSRRKESQS